MEIFSSKVVDVNVPKLNNNEISPIKFNTWDTWQVTKTDLNDDVPGGFILYDVLSSQECDQFISQTEGLGYEEALITTSKGMVSMPDVRDNYRLMWDVNDNVLAPIWARVKDLLPQEIFGGSWKICGLNERLRFYRYDPGQCFQPHYDGPFKRNNNEQSHLSFIIYLNDDFVGGATTFYYGKRKYCVQPKKKEWL